MVRYEGATIHGEDHALLENFEIPIQNTLPFHHNLPGKIEAENFLNNVGFVVEHTTDLGGGENVGYTHTGDFLTYRIRVPVEGVYPFEVRVASNGTVGKLKLEQRTPQGDILESKTIDIPTTGGWQNWITIKDKIKLSKGSHLLRVTVVQPEFNINWFRFLEITTITPIEKSSPIDIAIYPNPATSKIQITSSVPLEGQHRISILSSQGVILKTELTTIDATLNLEHFPSGVYILELNDGHHTIRKKFIIN